MTDALRHPGSRMLAETPSLAQSVPGSTCVTSVTPKDAYKRSAATPARQGVQVYTSHAVGHMRPRAHAHC